MLEPKNPDQNINSEENFISKYESESDLENEYLSQMAQSNVLKKEIEKKRFTKMNLAMEWDSQKGAIEDYNQILSLNKKKLLKICKKSPLCETIKRYIVHDSPTTEKEFFRFIDELDSFPEIKRFFIIVLDIQSEIRRREQYIEKLDKKEKSFAAEIEVLNKELYQMNRNIVLLLSALDQFKKDPFDTRTILQTSKNILQGVSNQPYKRHQPLTVVYGGEENSDALKTDPATQNKTYSIFKPKDKK